jgi:hypothetical protein
LGTNATTRLTIDSSGNVGIGTSSPSQKLHVSGGDTTNVGFNGTTKGVRFDFDGTQASIFGVDNTFFASYQPLRIGGSITQFMYGGTEAARIDSSGNVGIGTTTPGFKVAINDPGTGLGFTNAASGNFNLGLLGGTGSNEAYVYQRANGPLLFGTNNTERLRIDSSGSVGIGTSSPSATLELSGTGTVFKANTATTTSTAISLQLGGLVTSSNSGCFIKSHVNLGSTLNSELSFEVNGGALEAARIDSSGNVGIGTTSPHHTVRCKR